MIGFGTGGWRAVIGEEFTKANVQLLTAALARKMKDEGTQGNGFVIGYDRRFLSVEAAKWAAEVPMVKRQRTLIIEQYNQP